MIKDAISLLESIKNLNPEDSQSRERMLDSFLMANYQVGLQININENYRKSPEFDDYVELMVETLKPNRHWVKLFVTKLENIFAVGFQHDEWEQACIGRSALEFLCEISEGTALESSIFSIDFSPLEERMMEVGEREGFANTDKIPGGIPESHWWWWYPNS